MGAGAEGLDVSRETFERLEHFCGLVQKWTRKINLVSKGDIEEVWQRHIVDSVQIHSLAPEVGTWLDIGSGGGFPGVVVVIMDAENNHQRPLTLMDSDQRKCTFLRTAIRELGLTANVIAARIEEAAPQEADILSARALAPVSQLCGFAERHLKPSGVALLPKGRTWRTEVEEAEKAWSYRLNPIKSNTDPEAVILQIKEIKRV